MHERKSIGFGRIASIVFRRYPERAVLSLSPFIGQAFLHNEIIFGFGEILTTFFMCWPDTRASAPRTPRPTSNAPRPTRLNGRGPRQAARSGDGRPGGPAAPPPVTRVRCAVTPGALGAVRGRPDGECGGIRQGFASFSAALSPSGLVEF
ncbi:hypothetical protein GA0115259_109195 [Streptomyces sp. MnatMP-M17]|nr:hypothetical protein GA0115259_109195 [Streptomyces sp. MnatMP-M17]